MELDENELEEKFYRIVYELDKSVDINKHWLFEGRKKKYFPNLKAFYKKYPNFKCEEKKKELLKIRYFLKYHGNKLKYQAYYDKKFFDYIDNTSWDSIYSSFEANINSDIIFIDYDEKNKIVIELIEKLKNKYKIENIFDGKKDLTNCKYFINLKKIINPNYLEYFYKNNVLVLSLNEEPDIKYRDYIIYFKKENILEKILKILDKSKSFDIIVPCFNTDKYIHKTIKSIFSQTYKNFKVHIINDNSTDNTLNEIKKYESNPNIQIYSNNINLGKYMSINKIVDNLKSDYFLVLDSDDVIKKNRLLYDLMAFTRDKKTLLVQSKYIRYNEINGNIILEPSFGENIITYDRKIFELVGRYYDTRFGGDTEFLERVIKFLGEEVAYQIDKLTYLAIIRKDESNLTKTIGKKDRLKFVGKYRQLHELNNVNFFIELCK